VNLIVTELGVIEVTEQGLVLREIFSGTSPDDVKKWTEASLHIADNLRTI
jgi:acetate CoA/acetoacetate CoA-transferase beta subunit